MSAAERLAGLAHSIERKVSLLERDRLGEKLTNDLPDWNKYDDPRSMST